jgi:hypothetical protein
MPHAPKNYGAASLLGVERCNRLHFAQLWRSGGRNRSLTRPLSVVNPALSILIVTNP